VAWAATLPPARVAKQLRWRLIDLTKQMATPHAAPATPLGFVAVPATPAGPQATAAPPLELARVDGTRRCLHTPCPLS